MTYIISQFRGRTRRAVGVVAGVALGAALFVALSALGSGFREAARLPLMGLGANLIVTRPAGQAEAAATNQVTRGVRTPFGLATLSAADVDAISGTDGVAGMAAALQLWDFGPTSYQTVLGIDPAQDSVGPARALSDGLRAGRAFGPDERGVAVADRHYATFFGLKPGSRVTIGGQSFEVVGVAEQKNASQTATANLYVPLADAQALAGLAPGEVNQVYLRVASAADVDAVVARLTQRLGQVSAITEDSVLQVMGGIGRVSVRFAEVAAAIGLLGGLLLTWFALSGLVAERRREIGLMKAVGWQRGSVALVFLLEALVLSMIGGLLGIALGWGGAWLLGQLPLPPVATPLSQTLPGLSMAAPAGGALTLPAQADLSTLGLAFLVAAGGGALAGWSGARRAASLKPAQALRDR